MGIVTLPLFDCSNLWSLTANVHCSSETGFIVYSDWWGKIQGLKYSSYSPGSSDPAGWPDITAVDLFFPVEKLVFLRTLPKAFSVGVMVFNTVSVLAESTGGGGSDCSIPMRCEVLVVIPVTFIWRYV